MLLLLLLVVVVVVVAFAAIDYVAVFKINKFL